MPSTAEEVMTLAISAVSYCLGFFKYGLVSFKDFFLMTYYTSSPSFVKEGVRGSWIHDSNIQQDPF